MCHDEKHDTCKYVDTRYEEEKVVSVQVDKHSIRMIIHSKEVKQRWLHINKKQKWTI